MCTNPYGVSCALEQEVYCSVNILVTVMEGNHALILSFSSNLN